MANQPPPPRSFFRLPSLARPAPPPEPTPTPAAPVQPRPALARPALRSIQPVLPTTQPQEPPPTAAPGAPPAAPVQRSPPKPGGGVASVPSSPVPRASAPTVSLPSSPVQTATTVGPVTTSSSVQSSPRPRAPAPAISSPPAPVYQGIRAAQTSSVPPSPENKPMPTTLSVPTSPTLKLAPTTTSMPASPTNKAVTTTTTASVPSSVAYPRPINSVPRISPTRSPKPNSTAPPPSPLILPPARIKSDAETEAKIPLETEQKAVLFQKTIDKPSKPRVFNGSQSERDLAEAIKSSIGNAGKLSDSEDGGMRVITIAGDNKGAFMEVIRSPSKKHGFEGNPHRLHKKDNDPKSDGFKWRSSSSSSSGEEEGKPKMKDKNHKGKGTANSLPMTAFMNSNVQGVNNSIVYNSTCTHHDPGVHLALSRKLPGGGINVKDLSNVHRD